MGMPIILDVPGATHEELDRVFGYFHTVDARFSTYKHSSEVSRFNRGEIGLEQLSLDFLEILSLAEEAHQRTQGYFDIRTPDGLSDPSGLVKGWAIWNAARLVKDMGYSDYWVEAGGDIATSGVSPSGFPWSIGVRHPFDAQSVVQVIYPQGRGVATSGTYTRGMHIYDPYTGRSVETPYVSLTVVAPDVYEADLWATAAFAMGADAMPVLEATSGLEAFAIDTQGIATLTSGWESLGVPEKPLSATV